MENKELEKLKALYPEVYTLTVKNKAGETITVYLKELDRVVYKSVSSIIQKDELLGIESMIKSLRIGGDEAEKITNDFKALRSAGKALMPMLEVEEGELKKN